jgi:hypothetical protein
MAQLQTVDVPQLLQLSGAELDDLYRSSDAGEIPRGKSDGAVLFAPGSVLEGPFGKAAHLLAWKGKVFDPERGDLLNRVSPFDVRTIRAKVYKEASWLDGRETIVLDYSKTSRVAHWIRDEIREVGPGVYLGLVYWSRARILHFALTFPD